MTLRAWLRSGPSGPSHVGVTDDPGGRLSIVSTASFTTTLGRRSAYSELMGDGRWEIGEVVEGLLQHVRRDNEDPLVGYCSTEHFP